MTSPTQPANLNSEATQSPGMISSDLPRPNVLAPEKTPTDDPQSMLIPAVNNNPVVQES